MILIDQTGLENIYNKLISENVFVPDKTYKNAVIKDPDILDKQLDFIKTNGGYIDTGVKPKEGLKVILSYSDLTTTASDGYCGLFGARASAGDATSFVLWRFSASTYRADINTTQKQISGTPDVAHIVELTDMASSNLVVDGTSNSVGNSSVSSSTDYTIYISSMNTGGTDEGTRYGSRFCDMNIYYCKIYDGDTLVRDFVPYLSGSTYGLYDKVNKTFYSSKLSDKAFTGGSIVNNIKGYENDLTLTVKYNNEKSFANYDSESNKSIDISVKCSGPMVLVVNSEGTGYEWVHMTKYVTDNCAAIIDTTIEDETITELPNKDFRLYCYKKAGSGNKAVFLLGRE